MYTLLRTMSNKYKFVLNVGDAVQNIDYDWQYIDITWACYQLCYLPMICRATYDTAGEASKI